MFGLRLVFVVGGEQEVTLPPSLVDQLTYESASRSHPFKSTRPCASNDYFVTCRTEVCPGLPQGQETRAIVTTLIEFPN